MTSKEMRTNNLFMRNDFDTVGKYEFPLIKKQVIELHDIKLISYSDTRKEDCSDNKNLGVHFFY